MTLDELLPSEEQFKTTYKIYREVFKPMGEKSTILFDQGKMGKALAAFLAKSTEFEIQDIKVASGKMSITFGGLNAAIEFYLKQDYLNDPNFKVISVAAAKAPYNDMFEIVTESIPEE